MPILLIGSAAESPLATVGGRPLAPPLTNWPTCHTCKKAMQFLAQLPLEAVEEAEGHRDQVLLLFQCQSQPGLCDEWDPNLGGNAALLVASLRRSPMPVPAGATLLPEETRVQFITYSASDGNTPDDEYCNACDAPGSAVVGKLGGAPLWIQGDETPSCECGQPMSFVAQLEERGGGGINFGGGGAGYAFVCRACRESSKFLWQCT
jgi:hypothetical protein